LSDTVAYNEAMFRGNVAYNEAYDAANDVRNTRL
jgi:hypothetical protein